MKIKNGNGKYVAVWAHRLSFAIFVRPLRDGESINHKKRCLNRSCINPDCLEPMSMEENRKEMMDRRFGEDGHNYDVGF